MRGQNGGIVRVVAHGRGLPCWPTPTCAVRSAGRLADSVCRRVLTAVYLICTQNEFEIDSGVRTQPLVNQIDLLTKRVREFESFFRGVDPNPWGWVRVCEDTTQNRERGFQVVERQPRANG